MTPRQPFRVLASATVIDRIRELLDRFARTPRHGEIVAAFLRIVDDLRHGPMEVGEEREFLANLRLAQRIGFRQPLMFRYAVQLDTRPVWLQSIRLYPDN